ncbi:hypothetical protein PLESTB_000743500 [Pleodorina starrii]|uniref:Uncharacterized protein n=1 Tax=Pleodorina starrii TaxID=330485 RepID=A0A9W6BKH6_9CHLO|nr:hypothetical protein PLESTM_000181200 [Pleodorina starrii]GLC53425.1 hypothetical protein PLESTB_000743500 [Pleodorina starrii]GLC69750.1 hypothetical protein PLESTF_000875700 [Pleodorina starrii]
MSGLAELERTKRRRLQEAYADLRPSGKNDDDRQAKLRNLLLGAAADAGIPTGISPPGGAQGGSGSSTGVPQSVRALAAAAAASIAGVESHGPKKRSGGGGGGSMGSIGSPGGSSRTGPAYGTSTLSGGRRRGPDGSVTAVRAPPPGPMEGGFLPEADPITRLGQLPVPLAAVGSPSAVGPAGAGRRGVGAAGPGAAAAATTTQRYDMYDNDDDGDDAEADVPSDVELALMALKSDLRSHPGAAELPPLALRSQLSCLLADRSTVERQLDEQRRANRVRVFKLPTGTDEFGILSTSDYRALVRQAADDAAAAAAEQQQQQGAAPSSSSGAYGVMTAAAARPGSGSRWHSAADAFLRRVVDRFTDFELSRDHLFHLLRTAPPTTTTTTTRTTCTNTTATTAGQPPQRPPHGGQQGPAAGAVAGRQGAQRSGGGSAAAAAAAPSAGITTLPLETVEEQVSLLLHTGCIARHTDGDADAFVLAVPGVGKLVKAVLGGRRELLTWLSKRQHHEAPEEQIRKLKLRSSCLPPLYHVRDLVGLGAVKQLDSTCGPVIRLPQGSKRAAG